MNTGAFGEGFPYSNFHDLNMDWIIKIAKDFLDQYTHIQDIIAQGITDIGDKTDQGISDLEDKETALEALLQAWYDTHSEDIADQLADALADLNDWYTTHQNYLDQTLAANILAFDTHATAKAAETLESIPEDYTTLGNDVTNLKSAVGYFSGTEMLTWEQGGLYAETGLPYSTENAIRCPYIAVGNNSSISIFNPYEKDVKIYEYSSTGDDGFIRGSLVTDDQEINKQFNVATKYIRLQISGTGVVVADAIGLVAIFPDGLFYEIIKNSNMVGEYNAFMGTRIINWEKGALYTATGLPYDSANAVRSEYIPLNGNDRFIVINPEGKAWKVFQYTGTGESDFVDDTAASTNTNETISIMNSNVTHIRLQVNDSNGADTSYAKNVAISMPDGFIYKHEEKINKQLTSLTGIRFLEWEQGGLYTASGLPSISTNAIRTLFVSTGDNDTLYISNPDERSWKVFEYSGTGSDNFVRADTTSTLKEGKISLHSSTTYIRIQLNATGILPSAADNFSISFPDGYIFLMNTKINDQITSFTGIRFLDWEQGGLYANTGLPSVSNNAVRTPYIDVQGNNTLYINNPDARSWKIYQYSGLGESDFIRGNTASTSKEGTLTLDASTTYIRIQLNRTGGITVAEAKNFSAGFPDGLLLKELNKDTRNSISILFVGNSLTQDGIAYLPYILKTYYPEINFKFYIWYNGGKTLAEQYDEYFSTDTPCSTFSVAENNATWSNYSNSKTMSDICSTYTFDIVCMQEYFNYKQTYSAADLVDWTRCQNYISSHYTGGNGLEFITLFHAPLRSSADSVFNLTKSGIGLILKKTIADNMIPNGIAIYRAMDTTLDNLGDEGHLSSDGTHAQEGLPCLLQTYSAVCWLLDKLAIPKSIYGIPFKMTTEVYETLNVPGPNVGSGIIEGTDEQNQLAQVVAIKAYKEGKQFVMENISEEN